MSGHGAPQIEPENLISDSKGLRVAIVAAQWHTQIMDALLDGALRAARASGVEPVVVRVPGSFELTAATARLVRNFDAVVALGVVIRGGTPHFEYVCQAATLGLSEISSRTATPIGFGLLTCDTEEQALARSGLPGSSEDKGFEAMMAAVATCIALQQWS